MKVRKCDVCGELIDTKEIGAHFAGTGLPLGCDGLFGVFLADLDAHRECIQIGKEIDMRELVLREWRDRVLHVEKYPNRSISTVSDIQRKNG